jgi:hypothetical protein
MAVTAAHSSLKLPKHTGGWSLAGATQSISFACAAT